MTHFQSWSSGLIIALIASCPTSVASEIAQATPVTKIGHWSIECNAEPKCYAVGVLPPRKARIRGVNAALEIEFTHPRGINAGLTLLPLDGSLPLREVKLTPRQGQLVLEQLNLGTQFMIWVEISEDEIYYVPGQRFNDLISFVQLQVPTFIYPHTTLRLPSSSPQVKGMQFRTPPR